MKITHKNTNAFIYAILLLTLVSSKVQTGMKTFLLQDVQEETSVDGKCFLGNTALLKKIIGSNIEGFQAQLQGENEVLATELFKAVTSLSEIFTKANQEDIDSILSANDHIFTQYSDELGDLKEKFKNYLSSSEAEKRTLEKEFAEAIFSVGEKIKDNEELPYYAGRDIGLVANLIVKLAKLNAVPTENESECVEFNFLQNYDQSICDLNTNTVRVESLTTNTIKLSKENLSESLGVSFTAKVSLSSVLENNGKIVLAKITNLGYLIEIALVPTTSKDSVDVRISVGDKVYTINTETECNDIINIILSIEKTEAGYILNIIYRSVTKNERKELSTKLNADLIENANITVNSDYKSNKFHFVRSCNGISEEEKIEQEIELVNKTTSESELILEEILSNECKNKLVECQYQDNANCLKCKDNNYLLENKDGNTCVEICPVGTFIDQNTKTCQPCNIRCEICQNSDSCEKCKSPFVLNNNTCVDKCPDNKWKVDGVCEECTDNCNVCKSESECQICKTGYVKEGECVEECGEGYFTTSNPAKCNKCGDNCQKCVDQSECKACNEGFYLQDGKCVEECKDGKFKCDLTKKCQDCPVQCLTCTDKETCQTCNENYNLLDNKCITDCPVGYTPKDKFCLPCDKGCDKCDSNDPKKCTECSSDRFLKNNKCVTDCCVNHYADDVHNRCVPCIENCLICQNGVECNECENGFLLKDGSKCVDTCPNRQVAVDKKCIDCDPDSNCKACDNTDVSKCLICFSGDFFYNDKCVPVCPEGTFTSGTTCVDCKDNCKTCSNSITCDSCESPLVLKDNDCVETCGDGYTPTDEICQSCEVSDCASCDENINSCDECANKKVYLNGECLENCPANYFQLLNNCFQCTPNCEKCVDGDTCDECALGYNYDQVEHKCVKNCPEQTVSINKVCESCEDTSCLTCAKDKTTCETCPEDMPLNDDGDCVKTCPEGKVANEANSSCIPCEAPCETCSENVKNCETCVENYALEQESNTCVDQCPEKTANVDQVCTPCKDQTCLVCKVDLTSCLKCEEGRFLYGDKCMIKCPDGTFPDSETGKC